MVHKLRTSHTILKIMKKNVTRNGKMGERFQAQIKHCTLIFSTLPALSTLSTFFVIFDKAIHLITIYSLLT